MKAETKLQTGDADVRQGAFGTAGAAVMATLLGFNARVSLKAPGNSDFYTRGAVQACPSIMVDGWHAYEMTFEESGTHMEGPAPLDSLQAERDSNLDSLLIRLAKSAAVYRENGSEIPPQALFDALRRTYPSDIFEYEALLDGCGVTGRDRHSYLSACYSCVADLFKMPAVWAAVERVAANLLNSPTRSMPDGEVCKLVRTAFTMAPVPEYEQILRLLERASHGPARRQRRRRLTFILGQAR